MTKGFGDHPTCFRKTLGELQLSADQTEGCKGPRATATSVLCCTGENVARHGATAWSASHIRGGLLATASAMDRDRALYPAVAIVMASYYPLFAVIGESMRALV